MRKKLLRLLFLAACILPLMCSCSKEEDNNGQKQEQKEEKKEVNFMGEWELEVNVKGDLAIANITVTVHGQCDSGEIKLYNADTNEQVGEIVPNTNKTIVFFQDCPNSGDEAKYHLKTSSNCIGITLNSSLEKKLANPVEIEWSLRKDGFFIASGKKTLQDPAKEYLEMNGRTMLETYGIRI